MLIYFHAWAWLRATYVCNYLFYLKNTLFVLSLLTLTISDTDISLYLFIVKKENVALPHSEHSSTNQLRIAD